MDLYIYTNNGTLCISVCCRTSLGTLARRSLWQGTLPRARLSHALSSAAVGGERESTLHCCTSEKIHAGLSHLGVNPPNLQELSQIGMNARGFQSPSVYLMGNLTAEGERRGMGEKSYGFRSLRKSL